MGGLEGGFGQVGGRFGRLWVGFDGAESGFEGVLGGVGNGACGGGRKGPVEVY